MSAGERKAGFPGGGGSQRASYGKTQAQLEELRKDQKAGTVKMKVAIPGRKGQSKDDPYMVPEVEYLYHYHLEVEIPHYDQTTGERMDAGPHILKLHENAYAQAIRVNKFAGKQVEIIHDPTMAQAAMAGAPAKTPDPVTVTHTKEKTLDDMKGQELVDLATKYQYPKKEWDKLKVPELREYINTKLQDV